MLTMGTGAWVRLRGAELGDTRFIDLDVEANDNLRRREAAPASRPSGVPGARAAEPLGWPQTGVSFGSAMLRLGGQIAATNAALCLAAVSGLTWWLPSDRRGTGEVVRPVSPGLSAGDRRSSPMRDERLTR
jgi:hypothetical protein